MGFVSRNDNLFEKETFERFVFPEVFSAFPTSHKTLDVVIQVLKNVKCFPFPFLLPVSPLSFLLQLVHEFGILPKELERYGTTN